MPLKSINVFLVCFAHRVVSTDSLIMPRASEREKEWARTYTFFRTFTQESIYFHKNTFVFFLLVAGNLEWRFEIFTIQVNIQNKIYFLLLLQECYVEFSLRNMICTPAEMNLARLRCPFSLAGKTQSQLLGVSYSSH